MVAQHHYNAALNRVYYAAFYAARALLALRRLDSSRHSGVIALFQQHFVKTGVVSDDDARLLPQAFTKRLQTDYGDFKETTIEEISALRADAGRFVAACERALVREVAS